MPLLISRKTRGSGNKGEKKGRNDKGVGKMGEKWRKREKIGKNWVKSPILGENFEFLA